MKRHADALRCPGLRWAGLVAVVLFTGCSPRPSVDSLTDSFIEQIAAIELVENFVRDGTEVSFVRRDGSGESIAWRVRIDSAVVEHQNDESPTRGIVSSTWYLNGRPVVATGDTSNLPMWVLETGVSQDCWALWQADSGRWGWT